MKRDIQKVIIFILFFTLCFSLIGCGNKNSDKPQYQEVLQSQKDTPEKVENIVTQTDNNEHIVNSSDDNENIVNPTDDNENIVSTTDNNETIESDNIDNQDTAIVSEEKTEIVKKDIEYVFEETSEIVYASSNVNIRTSYTTDKDNVISVLKKGKSIERIGIHEVWSKVLFQNEVCYIKTDYLTSEKPVIEEIVTQAPAIAQSESTGAPASGESFIAKLNISSEINQLVCVVGNDGSDCTVSFHIKGEDGKWLQQFSVDGDLGSKGITYDKSENDQKTPAGLFSFTLAFGIEPDPGAKLSYRQITEYDYWIDDIKSPYYNTWLNSQEIPGDYSSEHLIEHNPSYHYALNINYNPDCIPGLGSAIFMHGYNGSGRTTGCIAISEKYIKTLVQKVDSSTKILIVPSSADLANY